MSKHKVYKVVLIIEDFDELGPDEIKDVIENEQFPNHCMYPQVESVKECE